MKHLLLLGCLVFAVLAHAQPVEVPEPIATMYNELCIAVASGDNEGARGHVTQLAALQATFMAQGDKEHILRLAETYKIDSLTPTFTLCIAKGEVALVGYDLKLIGSDKQSKEHVEKTWHCQDQLFRSANTWLIGEHGRVDPDALKLQVKNGIFRNAKRGVEVAVPKDWLVSVPVGGPGAVVGLQSPDLLASATVLAVDLPVKVDAKTIVESENRLLLAAGVNQQIISQGGATLAGQPAYRAVSKIASPEMTVFTDTTYRVDSTPQGDVLYALAFGAERDEPSKVMPAEADAITKSLKLTGVQQEELPPELGKLADGKYINNKYTVSMKLAEGWKPRISKSRFLFQLSLAAPEGDSSFLLAAVDVGQYIDPKLVAQQDQKAAAQTAPGAKLLGEGARDQEGVPGYQTLQELALAPGKLQTRWSCYFTRDKVIYFIIGDAVPATDYDKVKDAWGQMVNSLTWIVDAEG